MPYQDGQFPSGAPVITINSVGFIANSFTVNDTAATTNINDQNGEHAGALSFRGVISGSMELQIATDSTSFPQTAARSSTWGVTSSPVTILGVARTLFLTNVVHNKPNQGQWTAQCDWQARHNA